jgi:hypothetical protein
LRRAAWFVAFAVFAATRTSADTGPVKHWAAFPGRDVRAVSFRGDPMGAEPSYRAVAGRDGLTYLRGRFGLYRLLGDDGRYEKVADTGQCSGWSESHGADAYVRVPAAVCSRASTIIVAMPTWHKHIRTPAPNWPDAFASIGRYRVDERYLTAVIADADGYWFAYGAAGGYGYMPRSGRGATLWDVSRIEGARARGMRRFDAFGHVGGDAYVVSPCTGLRFDRRTRRLIGDAGTYVIGLRAGRVVARRRYPCLGYEFSAIRPAPDGSLWIAIGGAKRVEHVRANGFASFTVGMVPRDVAVTKDGTAYVLGLDRFSNSVDGRGHPVVGIIAPNGRPDVRTLPMTEADSISIDGSDRIWIAAASIHAAALVSARGASVAPRRSTR